MAAITWTGAAGDHNFNNAANWSPAQVPGASDTIAFNAGALANIGYNTTDTVAGISLAAGATLAITDYGNFNIGASGTLSNAGLIALQSTNDATVLAFDGTSTTLSGAGTIQLGDNSNNYIVGGAASDVLINSNNLIEGGGRLGNGQLTLSNAAAGVIDGNAANTQMVVNTGTSTLNNAGLIEAGAGAGLQLQSARVDNSGGGTVSAVGGFVQLNGATLVGGVITSTGTNSVYVAYNQSATLDGSVHAVTNKGQFTLNDYASATLLGSIVNNGTIALNSTNDATVLAIGPATGPVGTVTLSGTGNLVLGNNANNYINASQAGDGLVSTSKITGTGTLGLGGLNLINKGTINATGLTLDTQGTVSNSALIEATGGAGLTILNTTISNSGTILASGGNIDLYNSAIVGGALTAAGTSVNFVGYNQTGTLTNVTSTGILQLNDYATLDLSGTLTNKSTVSLQAVNDSTDLVVISPTLTLTGGGSVLLDDSSANRIYGALGTDVLDNINNLIAGSGQLGVAQLTLINEAAGTISATGTAAGLQIDTAGSTLINHGLIEATGSAGMVIQSTNVTNTGTILAKGGNIDIFNSSITGGLLTTGGASVNYVAFNQTATLTNVTNAGILQLNDYATVNVVGTLTNTGTVTLGSTNDTTNLVFGPVDGSAGTATLTGGGLIVLDDNGANRIYGVSASDTLVNLNNTISGSGQLGVGQLNLINDATINSNATVGLTINLTSFVNNALLESTGSGGIALNNTVVTNAGTVAAAGGNIALNNSTIAGGLLTSGGGGAFVVNYNLTGTLDGSTHAVTNTAAINVADYGTLDLLGSIVNDAAISFNSTNDNTDLIVASPRVTLTGAGTIALDNNGGNRIYGASAANVLDNVNNIITGAGQIGAGQLTLINEAAGVIDASAAMAMTINTGGTITNSGLIEATGTGGILLTNSVLNNSTGGTLLAAGGNVHVVSATIAGGVISGAGSSEFYVGYNEHATLDGTAQAVTNRGLFVVQDYGTLYVDGAIANQGTIALNSTNDSTDLIINTPTVTLTGSGTILLDNNGANRIYGAAVADVLDNVNNTIAGAGQLGLGQLTLINGGTIAATDSTALIVNLGSTGTNTASGQMLGQGAGGLIFQNGTYTNAGLIQADDGSSVTFQSTAALTNDSATGTLTGGTYGAVASGHGATLSITGAAVTTDAATLLLSGAGSEILFGGTTIEASLKIISKGAQLKVLGNRAYTTANSITSSGTMALGGGVFTAKSLTDKTGSLLSGYGTLASSLTSAGAITATGGTLDLHGKKTTISGAVGGGTVAFDHSAVTLSAGTTLSAAEITMINKASLAVASNVSFAGTFAINGAASLTGAGSFTNTGLFEQTGKGLAAISDPFANNGTLSTVAGGTLAFSGGLANTGIILDNGTFTDTAALTGGSLTIGKKAAAVLGSTTGAGNSTLATLTLGAGTLNTSGTTLSVTGDYNNTAAGTGNAYTPFAGVTGTIDGVGTQLAVVGVNGTTITSINGTETISVAPGGHATFVIENTGAAGSAALRGALQTTVNGGTINGTALSGSGVTAGNFGPLAAGSASGTYTIAYSGGTLAGEAIHIASDFANVAGLTIDIVAAPAAAISVPAEAAIGSHLLIWTHL